jgi:biotin carboxyl carrier protein
MVASGWFVERGDFVESGENLYILEILLNAA